MEWKEFLPRKEKRGESCDYFPTLNHLSMATWVGNSRFNWNAFIAVVATDSTRKYNFDFAVFHVQDHSVTIDGKSTDASLVSNVLEEVKLLLQSP